MVPTDGQKRAGEHLARQLELRAVPLRRDAGGVPAAGAAAGQFRIPSIDASVLYVIGVCQALLAAVVDRELQPDAAEQLTREVLTMLLSGVGMNAKDAEHTAGRNT